MKRFKCILYLFVVVFLTVILIFMGTGIVQFTMTAISKGMKISISEDMLYEVSGSAGICMASLILAVYVKRRKYDEISDVREYFSVLKVLWCMIISICICKVITESFTGLLFSNIFPIKSSDLRKTGYISYIFSMLAAPVFEELLFRYGLYNLIKQKFSRTVTVIITAVIFALVHGYHIQGFISCLSAGMVFTLIYIWTKDIRYCIAAHMSCNIFAFIMNKVQSSEINVMGKPLQYDNNGYNMFNAAIIIPAVVICAMCLWKYYQLRKKETKNV